MKVGYIRISTEQQNTLRQEFIMEQLGVEKVFVDCMSGKDTQRPGLKDMMSFVREGDTVVVESVSRFARNTRDLLSLIDELTEKRVEFVSQKETIDTSTPTGKFMLTVFAAVSELEREYILQRQREGIEQAKRQGKYLGRKVMPLPPDFDRYYEQVKKGAISKSELARQLHISRPTITKWMRKYEMAL